ncbi:YPO3983 family protein [Enterobacteriaceae bacterium LUAb1]
MALKDSKASSLVVFGYGLWLTAVPLKTYYRPEKISDNVNPWMLTKIDKSRPFQHPRLGAYAYLREGEKITRQQCAALLFDGFRQLSRLFSVYGPYSHLIEKMITHMQNGNGSPFHDIWLDSALKEHILNDRTENSTLSKIKNALIENIDWTKNAYPADNKGKLRGAILDGKLPKFDRFQDNFNGMGITVHDTWATHITIKSLHIDNDRYRAVVHYKVQDHFGLDSDDISNFKFSQFHFFRIWFVLQRYSQFGLKPFMTNMEATVEITGDRK